MEFLHDWLPIFVSVVALSFTTASFIRTSHHETGEIAMERATMIADLRYIRQGIEDMKVDSKVMKEDLRSMESRITAVESSTASAHKRIDAFERRLPPRPVEVNQ